MTLPNIAGVVRSTYRGSNAAGQQWANVMHFQYAGGASQPGPVEIAALDAKVLRLYSGAAYTSGAAWFTFCTPDTKMIDSTHYVLNGTSTPVVIPHALAGTGSAGNNQAAEVANVITLRTAFRGRRYRGRIYLPGCSTTQMVGATGTVSATAVTSILTQARALIVDLATIQWVWGVASYGHGSLNGQPVSWTPFWTPLADVSMDGIPDVQRRRKQ